MGSLVELRAHNEFGEISSVDAAHGAVALYSRDDEHDGLRRISKRHETVLGETHEFAYGYDTRGRLVSVTRDAAPFESYSYDANGNRTRTGVGGQMCSATHGAQDQLL